MARQIPSDILLDVFGWLPAEEIYLTANMVSKRWNRAIERNAWGLPKKLIELDFEVIHRFEYIIRMWQTRGFSQSIELEQDALQLFWNPKFCLKTLHISNYTTTFNALSKAHYLCGNPIVVENLVLQTGYAHASQFFEEYENLANVIQPRLVKWRNTHRLADLKFLQTSRFFQTKSIEVLEVHVELNRERPFESFTVDELLDFIENADGNKKSLKSLKSYMNVCWNFVEMEDFAEKFVERFMKSKQPEQFFREFVSLYEGQQARRQWFNYFGVNGSLCRIECKEDRFVNSNRIVYEVGRKDGWKIGFGAQLDGIVTFYVYHASEAKSIGFFNYDNFYRDVIAMFPGLVG